MKKKAMETVATVVINFEEFIFSKVRNLTDATGQMKSPFTVLSTADR